MVRIDLDYVGLTFRVRPHGRITLKEYLVRRLFRRSVSPQLKVRALHDIHLHIEEGERVGIIGPNGAGKSTLLKLLAGVYPPTRGQRRVAGRISSLFDYWVGFEPEANGWDNIRYRGYLQGESARSIHAKLDSIAEFSGLGQHLDIPVRHYSSGMLVRLAFAVATAIDPEILLVDEVLGVGDLAFQEKARQRMQEMMARARLMVLVSHDLEALTRMSSRLVWLDQGRIRQVGTPRAVVDAYRRHAGCAEQPAPAPVEQECAAA